MRDSEFEFIRTLVYERSRISLDPRKRELVAARVAKRLRERGARTFAQDEFSSVVYGMPKAARENDGAETTLPLAGIAAFLARSVPPGAALPAAAIAS